MSLHHRMEQFAQNAGEALRNEPQRAALRNATDLFRDRREQALAQAPDWQPWRDAARALKDHVLLHLDHYLLEFERNAQARGTTVHWAEDAVAACKIIGELAARHGARTAVKSKSMTTEEVHLNDALATAGVDTVETDLGEWIIQLAGETPFHIIVPAIHKDRRQIAALFQERLGTAADADVQALTQAARRALREKFAAAELGISGANFAVAETGSLLILENEGNARLCTSLPPVHVALVGIEKVLPRAADLELMLALLPRSGTGQRLTTYQSLLTGPTEPGRDGPREVHIVLLDNGRSRMLREPVTRQALACIRCGACLNACPVYQTVGGHAYGSVYPGPIGAVITPQLQSMAKARALPFASSLCGACRDVCPVQIDIPALLLHLRARLLEGDRQRPPAAPSRVKALLFRLHGFALRGPRRHRFAAWCARAALRWCAPLLRRLPPLRHWAQGRDLPQPAPRTFRSQWARRPARSPR